MHRSKKYPFRLFGCICVIVLALIYLRVKDEAGNLSSERFVGQAASSDREYHSMPIEEVDLVEPEDVSTESSLDLWLEQRFPEHQVLEQESRWISKDESERKLLLDTGFKYSKLIVRESISHNTGYQNRLVLKREVLVADRILVRLAKGVPLEKVTSVLEQHGQRLLAQVGAGRVWAVGLPHATLDGLEKHMATLSHYGKMLELITPDYLHFSQALPDDFQANQQWGLKAPTYGYDIDAESGWDLRNSAAGIVVGVLDTGVSYTHEDMVGNMWTNLAEIPGNGIDDDSNGYVDDVNGIDVYNFDSDPLDDGYHGTHVAGIIGAQGNNALGITGVAWNVQVMAVKFLNRNGVGTDSDALVAIDYAVENGASILNNSWGNDSYSQLLKDKILEHEPAGILFVAAAGNESRDIDVTPKYPASYDIDNVISVGAIRSSGYPVYNYGKESVDVLAPGYQIYSLDRNDESNYAYKSGTSMAAGFVTGVMALLKAEFPDESYLDLTDRLLSSSVYDIKFLDRAKTHGLINLHRALAGISRDEVVIDNQPVAPIAYSGSGLELEVAVSGGAPFEYQWYHNGDILSGEQSPSLSLDNLSLSDNGLYHVVITNLVGSAVSDMIEISVVDVAPIIVTDLQGRKAFTGQALTLKAGIEGSEPYTYQWYFNGSPVNTTSSKSFPRITNADQGEYQLAVTNAYGTTYTSLIELKIGNHYLQQWHQIEPTPSAGYYSSISYLNGLFIAVGQAGLIAVSEDAEQWVAPERMTEVNLARIAYGDGRYVVVGENGVIVTSDDALSWSSAASGVTDAITDVAYGNGVFVAVTGHHVLVSSDGLNWIAYFVSDKNLGKIAFGGGIFGIIADNTDYTYYTFRSSDGTSWTEGTPLVNTERSSLASKVEYRNDRFWLLEDGSLYDSSDLITWDNKTWTGFSEKVIMVENRTYKLTSFDISVFDPAVGYNQTVLDYYPEYRINDMTHAEGKLVAVGSGGVIFRSLDGSSMDLISAQMLDVAGVITSGHAGHLLVDYRGRIYRSVDGQTIELVEELDLNLSAVAYGNGLYMASLPDAEVLVSGDLINWQTYSTGTVASSNGLIFAGGQFWTLLSDTLRYSSDGIHWEEHSIPFEIEDLVFGNDVYVARSRYNSLRVSNDAVEWNIVELPDDVGRPSVMLWEDGLFRVLTTKAALLTSSDGVIWTTYSTTNLSTDPNGRVEQYYNDFVFHDGVYAVAGRAGLYLSYDSINWIQVSDEVYSTFAAGDIGMLARNYDNGGISSSHRRSEFFTASTLGGDVLIRSEISSFQSDRTMIVTSLPSPGYVFTGWTGDLTSTDAELLLDLTSSLSVRANFKQFNLSWRQAYFNSAEIAAGLSEGHLDSDGDSFSNYYEYLFGTNPRIGGHSGFLEKSTYAENQNSYMAFEMNRRNTDSTIQYNFEYSADLLEWIAIPYVIIEQNTHGDGTETIRLRTEQPIGEEMSAFYRISVEELNP